MRLVSQVSGSLSFPNIAGNRATTPIGSTRLPGNSPVAKNQIFAKGTWGGEWHPDFVPQEGDIIIKEHWAQSGFANTDLDQQLKQYGIEKIILIGMLANTCIESTGRFGMELGYHITLVKDATTAESLGSDARGRAQRSDLRPRDRLHQ
jgi:nicotinamidase-related amidase